MEVADTTQSGDDAHCKDGYKFHVLLVEDDEVTLCVVERLLKNCNYEVTVATNGRQALEILERCTPDLILTDLAMPELSGLELVDGVIHNERFSNIPVVVMSSNDSFTAVKEAMEAGAQDFLIKPIRRNELTTLWRHVWRNNPQRVATQPAACSRRPGHLSDVAAEASKQFTFASSNRPATKQSPSGPPITSHGPLSGDPLHNRAYMGNLDAVYAQHAGGASPAEASPLRMDASTDATTSQPDVGGLGTSGQEEWEVPVAAEDGAVGGSQGSPVVEHVVPPAHQDMVDLNIRPLDLPPPLERAGRAKGPKEEKPSALQELAELGARRYDEQVKERNKVAAEHRHDERFDQDVAAQSGGSFGTLHHSANSAFTHFAALVPPPCSRGDWGAYHDCGAATSNHCNPRLHTVPEWPTAAGFNSSVPSMSVGAASHQGSLQRQAAMTAAASQLHQQQLQQQQHLQQQQQMQQHQLQQHHQQQQQSLQAMHHPATLWMVPAMEMMQTQQQRFLQGLQEAIQQHRAATRHMSADAKRHRLAAVEKFRQKRKQRTFEKKVRYESRKKLAEARPRIKGQFVKADVAQQYQALQEKGQAEAAYALLQQQA